MTTAPTIYAWCFGHGRLHIFGVDGAWCTSHWVNLGPAAWSEASAENVKRAHFGDARFMHELPLEAQQAVIDQVQEREKEA